MDAVDPAVRVVLVDDESLVRRGLRLILEGDRSLAVVGEAADGVAALDVVRLVQPDVVLMDVRMPRLDGLTATERILADQPQAKVIVLTTFDTDDFVLGAVRLGASGFLLKDTPPQELIDAIHKVASGDTILSPSALLKVIGAVRSQPGQQVSTNARTKLGELTTRERDIAEAIGRGSSNAEIAAELYISVTTVKTHIGRILNKLDVSNRVQIAICVHNAYG